MKWTVRSIRVYHQNDPLFLLLPRLDLKTSVSVGNLLEWCKEIEDLLPYLLSSENDHYSLPMIFG